MTELEKYEKVNSAETLGELADIIRSFADKGRIKGRIKTFDAEKMAEACEDFENHIPNVLTRKYGIRQQAMYIVYYNVDIS